MDANEFREFGKAAVDFIADYMETIRERSVLPDINPGYLYERIPDEAPEKGENWKQILSDLDRDIMPGITHWQSPRFHAFYPTGTSYPSIVGEMFSAAFGTIGFHWTACPAATELEVIMMNWLGKLLKLPEEFLNSSPGRGGGVLQNSASETTLLCLLAAKRKSIQRMKDTNSDLSEDEIHSKLIAYTSDQANSSVEKAGILGNVQMKLLPTDEDGRLRADTLLEALKTDVENGLIPCYLTATLGTTGICSFDPLDELGPICKEYNVWLHVDAAYAGSAFILPEYRYLMNGIQYADSFNFNPHKWLLVNFDCSALWVKDSSNLIDTFEVHRIYLKSLQGEDTKIPEYRNWQISLGRRFRALKLWFTLRSYGVNGLQAHLRNHIQLANLFESLVTADPRFEISAKVHMGLVCFRIKGDNELTKKLHERITSRKNIYLIMGNVKNRIVLRFVVCSHMSQESDIKYAWNEIRNQTNILLHNQDKKHHNAHIKQY